MKRALLLIAVGILSALAGASAGAQSPSPHAISIPPWFVESFLDFREDIADASRKKQRVMVYFGQDGCPYCKLLMQTTFTETRIVDMTRRNLEPPAVDVWGGRGATRLYGRSLTGRQLA